MTTAEATSEIFLTAFKALPKKERDAVVEKMFKDKKLIHDLFDIFILQQRAKEPSRTLDEYLAEKKGK